MALYASRRQLCRYMVEYHHLSAASALHGMEELEGYLRKVGCVQYDPLDVVGRNPDLVFQSRWSGYRKGQYERLLYRERRFFDMWDKNMSICAVEDWPCFARTRERPLRWCREHPAAIEEITAYLKKHESACSSDFVMEERVLWWYGQQRLAKAALEAMCYAGLALVHHKKGTRRYYCLSERALPPGLLSAPDPNPTPQDYARWQVLRRVGSVGALPDRPGDAWLGIGGMDAAARSRAFAELEECGALAAVAVEGMKSPLYVKTQDLPLLEGCQRPLPLGTARILAPLDNLIWDRRLIEALFGFAYRWEVYTPAQKRQYGYYVLPVLAGERFLGRIELATDRERGRLIVKNFWWEEGAKRSAAAREAVTRGLRRFMRYNRCGEIERDCEI
ncbi:DNA glycosylase AlkZ-like family protein [Provencibacterium massiliense]|uniref:DNA glycosylase AlkZ-like family protein n=1 Tax=Provencibacterium massiliense TaxID=1841868 RepID=UPI0013565A99|nr:crosslink repair DNA glycosylase YcaQ family protein [Provencibacterium massiliense]